MRHSLTALSFLILIWPLQMCLSQTSTSSVPPERAGTSPTAVEDDQPESKRLFGIVPNFRTSPSLANYKPLLVGEKYKLASLDAFDRGTFILAAAFAGEAQLSNSERGFGQGAAGFGRYLGTSYADYVIGDFMTEAILPSFLHQDPRYFRRGKGTRMGRLAYAASQIVLTHSDTAARQFNYSEILGNSTAVAISTAYYPNSRNAGDAASKLAMQLAVDMVSNELKEFWPDIARKFSRSHKRKSGS